MTKTFSLADMARHFSLPESTARYYCKRFASFMVIHGEGRRKRYGEPCLSIISTIIEHMKMGKTANMVEEVLAARYPRLMDAKVTREEFQDEGEAFDTCASAHMAPQNSFSEQEPSPSASMHQMPAYAQNQNMAHSGAFSQANAMEGAAGQLLMKYIEQQSSALQSIAQSLSTLAAQQNDMQRMEDAARTSKEENVLLRQEVSVLKNLLHSSEQVHHDDLNQMRSWMSRLAQSYNNKTMMDTQRTSQENISTEDKNKN